MMSRPPPVRPERRKSGTRIFVRRFVRKPLKLSRAAYTMPVLASHMFGLRSTDELALPSFMGIGGVRSGSTWLHHNLAAHPDLYLPPTKELHFFNGQMHSGLTNYSRQFALAGDRISGEITPSYGVIPKWRVKTIRRLMPDLRLVLILRNPIDRAWSHALMKTARELDRPPEEVGDAEFVTQFRSDYSLERGRFTGIIDTWTSVFDPDQLHLAYFDDIVDRPREMLTGVLKHIGTRTNIDWDEVPFTKVIDRGVRGRGDVFGSSTTAMPDRYRDLLSELYADEIAQLARTLPGPAQRWHDELNHAR